MQVRGLHTHIAKQAEAAYESMLPIATADGVVAQGEAHTAKAFRVQNKISAEAHASALARVGWSGNEFEVGAEEALGHAHAHGGLLAPGGGGGPEHRRADERHGRAAWPLPWPRPWAPRRVRRASRSRRGALGSCWRLSAGLR